jgi:Activator of Hsp90 ATPase homolog 1-like protein
MTEPIRFSFEVACGPQRAFELWTTRISTWWPKDHSVSQDADLEVVLEGHLGGRIYERTSSGMVHEWGKVTGWNPPRMLGYTWHLGADPGVLTDVVIRFDPAPDGGTRVEIDHGGWDRFEIDGSRRRDANRNGWDGIVPRFVGAAEKGGAEWPKEPKTTRGS